MRIVVLLIFLLLSGLLQAQADLDITMGAVSTAIAEQYMSELGLPDVVQWPTMEFEGEASDGTEYTAKMIDMKGIDLFKFGNGNHYSVAFGSDQTVILNFTLPRAQMAGSLKIKAEDGMVNRKYSIELTGLTGIIKFKVTPGAEKIEILNAEMLYFNYKYLKKKLIKNKDSMMATLYDAFMGGGLGRLIGETIESQLENASFINKFVGPLRSLVQQRLLVPGKIVFTNPLGITATAEMEGLRTGSSFMQSLWTVHIEGVSNDEERVESLAFANGKPANHDNATVMVSMACLEKLATALAQNGTFSLLGRQWGMQFQAEPVGDISVKATKDNQLLFRIPLEINLQSQLGLHPKRLTAILEAKLRPKADPGEGLRLEITESKIKDVHGGFLSLAPDISGRILTRIFASRILEVFPKEPLLQDVIPLPDVQLDLQIGGAPTVLPNALTVPYIVRLRPPQCVAVFQ